MDEKEVRQTLAENLKKFRKQRGLSQMKLANSLQMAFTFINDIENCKKWVSPETLARFATFFGVPISAFFALPSEDTAQSDIAFFVQTLSAELTQKIQEVEERFTHKNIL
ncbi:MAG: helix-turn-helix domain-containing protein [Bacteroides sp.]|nr:helix-turn-helix domain-containing protein [Prevotella sp.]MCM1408171.1 helix-turn-helix domain-containing protein [Treponema brennaborense]MCM1469495.1 helix-turn-helix domain-containing protein [Bacteroides sp.]